MIFEETYLLSNGNKIPKIALGTWQVSNEDASLAVKAALEIGYRHIDTAAAYGNEEGVGEGIKASGISRNQIYITSKVPAEVKTYEEAKNVIAKSLENLCTDYIDLMLIHAPKPWHEMGTENAPRYFEENLEVWKALEEAYKVGSIKAIGVSNFEIDDIQNIINGSEVKPLVNQVRVHIGHTPKDVINYCKSEGILVEAYSPISTGRLLANKEVCTMAENYGVSVPQLCVRYILQLGLLPLPKTTKESHMKQNAEVSFDISKEDMEMLYSLEIND